MIDLGFPHKIYLSGPDGAGKSTIAEAFSLIGYTIKKWSKPKPGDNFKAKAFSQIFSDEELVLDRGWCGDLIYAEIFHHEPAMTKLDAFELLRYFRDRGGLLIYVTADEQALMDRVKERGDEFIKPHQIPEICNRYDKFFHEVKAQGIPFLKLDTTNLF